MKLLENNWIIIKNEIPKFDPKTIIINREQDDWLNDKGDEFIKKLENNDNWIKSWEKDNVWFNFPLMYRNNVIGKAEKLCPNTIKLLKSLKNINIAGYSLLIPYSKIDFHTDDTGPSFNSMAFNMLLSGEKSDLKIIDKNKIYIYKHKNG